MVLILFSPSVNAIPNSHCHSTERDRGLLHSRSLLRGHLGGRRYRCRGSLLCPSKLYVAVHSGIFKLSDQRRELLLITFALLIGEVAVILVFFPVLFDLCFANRYPTAPGTVRASC